MYMCVFVITVAILTLCELNPLLMYTALLTHRFSRNWKKFELTGWIVILNQSAEYGRTWRDLVRAEPFLAACTTRNTTGRLGTHACMVDVLLFAWSNAAILVCAMNI